MNEYKKITKNYIVNIVYQIFTLITPLVTTPYISKVLGAKNIGIYSYTLSIVTYFMVIGSLGFPLYGQREVAFVTEDMKKRSSLFCQIILAQLILTLTTTILYLIFVNKVIKEYRNIYLIQVVGLIGYSFATNWFYMGIEKFEISVGKNIFVKFLSIILIFLFVKNPTDLLKYTFIMGISNVFGNLIILIDIKNYICFSIAEVSIKKIFQHIKPAFIMGIPYYITTIYAVIDRTMLGFFGKGYQEVGYYEQSQKIITLAMAFVTAISTVLLPRIANEVGKKNKEKIKELLILGNRIILITALPIIAGLIITGDMIIPWFFGLEFQKVEILIKIFSPLPLFMGITNLLANQYLIAVKEEKKLICIILISTIINCAMNIILIPHFNSIGAAYATVLSEMIKLSISLVYLKKIISIKSLFSGSIKYILSTLFMFSLLNIIKTKFDYTLLGTLEIVMIGIGIYLFGLIILKDEYTFILLKKIKNISKI